MINFKAIFSKVFPKLNKKSKEEYAKGLLSFSFSLYKALYSLIIIVPAAQIFQSSIAKPEQQLSFYEALGLISTGNMLVIYSLLIFLLFWAYVTKRRSLQLLNELSED